MKNYLLTLVTLFLYLISEGQPTLTSFTPVSGPTGTQVTITGAGFSTVKENNTVYFGSIQAAVSAATPASLTVNVPKGAVQANISVTVNHLTTYSAQPFLVEFPGGGIITSLSFESKQSFGTGQHPYGITTGDFDNDGQPDVATVSNANVPATFVSVHRNTGGSGTIAFEQPINLTLGDNGYGLTTADFDGDGKLDLAATYIANNGNVSVFRNTSSNGTIRFANPVSYTAGNSPYTVQASDIDNDGKPDLVICNYTGNSLSVLRNTSTPGAISFAAKVSFTTALSPWDLAVGDVDGDGKHDVVTGNRLSNNISLFKNTSSSGTISFASRIDIGTGYGPQGVAIGDLDGDKKPEIAVVNANENNVSVYRNISTIGSPSFAPRGSIFLSNSLGVNPERLLVSDLDSDGKPDLLVGGDVITVLKNISVTGIPAFSQPSYFFSQSAYRVGVADLDLDGMPDIFASNAATTTFSVFRNRVPLPQVNGIQPVIAAAGQSVVITGHNFSGVAAVRFGGVAASSFTVENENRISAVVGQGSSGTVDIATTFGVGSIDGFVFAGPPLISSVSSLTATTGDTVFISGKNLTGATDVSFGASKASYFTIVNPTFLKAVVGDGESGAITITTPYGTATQTGFQYLPVPIVHWFTPTTAAGGAMVAISGSNFTGITGVSFGGVPAASYKVISSSTIHAVVANGSSGAIHVSNAYGNSSKDGFTFLAPPVINSFTPTTAGNRAVVTITGSNFTGVAAVKFGSVNASSFQVVSDKIITAMLSYGESGSVSVTNTGGTATKEGFVYVNSPAIMGFTPKINGSGSVVTITGTHLATTQAVSFGGTPAAAFTVLNDNTITATVANGADGLLTVSTLGGEASVDNFLFTTAPLVNSFSPVVGPVGTVVTIKGANFNPSVAGNSVYFGAVNGRVLEATPNSLKVVVPSGATYQPFTIIANNQTASSATPFLATYNSEGHFTASSFLGRTDFETNGKPESISIGDLDGDNKADVVVANTFTNTISFFRNTSVGGELSFAAKIDSATGPHPHAVKLADVDGDGKLDILLLNYDLQSNSIIPDNTITIFRNISTPGKLSFAAQKIIHCQYRPEALAVVDLNLDGKKDLVVVHTGIKMQGQEFVSVFMNTSEKEVIKFYQEQLIFTTSETLSGTFFQGSIAEADVNNDGRTDLVIGFGLGDFVTVLKNNIRPGNLFANLNRLCIGGCWYGSGYGNLAAADFNADQKIDILTDSYILRNTTDNFSYSFFNQGLTAGGGIVAIGGLSGDAKPDYVRVNPQSNTISLFKNESNSSKISFAPAFQYATGTKPAGVAIADLNDDGKMDIAVTNQELNTFSVLLNGTGSTGPVISGFTPSSGRAGTTLTITGSNFTGVSAVHIGNVPVLSFTVTSSTTITAVIADGTSGNVTVTTANGKTSLAWFFYAPSITSFTPAKSGQGNSVTITGANFIGTTAVDFGGEAATSFTVVDASTIKVVVGKGASGNVSVTTPGGTATLAGFTWVPAPVITSFTPETGAKGTKVTISGANFTDATAIKFGGAKASSFQITSPATIVATVGDGATGNVFVTTPGGTVSSINQHFLFIPAPAITSFTPTFAVPGTTVTIHGSNFTGITAVHFGGTAAASFTVVDAKTITAVVATGASGDVSVTGTGGTAALPGFLFGFPTSLPGVSPGINNLVLFPNPAQTEVWINHPARAIKARIRVTDVYGREVKSLAPLQLSTQSKLDIQNLAAGIYLVVWSDGKASQYATLFKL